MFYRYFYSWCHSNSNIWWVLGQLLAKDETSQNESASAFKSLSTQCSSLEAIQAMIKHLFSVLNGIWMILIRARLYLYAMMKMKNQVLKENWLCRAKKSLYWRPSETSRRTAARTFTKYSLNSCNRSATIWSSRRTKPRSFSLSNNSTNGWRVSNSKAYLMIMWPNWTLFSRLQIKTIAFHIFYLSIY